ncbi:MAG: methyltransferase domain-containing protein [bacterium]|nr:methyltransferase domain-containing protein [bacterium]
MKDPILHTTPEECCSSEWEQAYRRFETPEQEVEKFSKRFLELGVERWPRETRIASLFCGRGNGMVALERMGFEHLSGFDLSESLLAQYSGPASCYVADCRKPLPVAPGSQDAAIIQGGLHHLPDLPGDLERVLAEIRRILTPEGQVVVVEPWKTPFLDLVHSACRFPLARRIWPKLDALAIMIEHERDTYEQWLARPREIQALLHRYYVPVHERRAWGKLSFVGRPR